MSKINYRDSARDHLANAKPLLHEGSDRSIRYACLELRMAIEALTYDSLQAYLSEVPNSVMGQWTPKKVIEELLAVDPYADQSAKVFVGIEEVFGEPSKDMQFLGEDLRFTAAWAHKAHNALGSFLHEPTIAQHTSGKAGLSDKAKAKADAVASELERILSASVFNTNFGSFITFDCHCGFKLKRKDRALKDNPVVECRECQRRYIGKEIDGGNYSFKYLQQVFTCKACEIEQAIGDHEVEREPIVSCGNCGTKVQIRKRYVIQPLDQVGGADSSDN